MKLSKEQLLEVKKQLIEQVQTTFPEDKKGDTIKQLEEMSDPELIEFVNQNNLIKQSENPNQQCIFCSIIFGDLPSIKVGENEKAIAILELNPVSEGHTLILPKEHISDPAELPEEMKELAKQLAEKIQKTLNPLKIDLINSETMGHQAINLLPIYKEETINSPRQKKTPEELTELKRKFEENCLENNNNSSNEKITEEKNSKVLTDKDMWLPNKKP